MKGLTLGGKIVAEAGWGTDMFSASLVVELEVKSQESEKQMSLGSGGWI